MSEIFGYPIDTMAGYTLTRGARAAEEFESYSAAVAAQKALPGSTLTYKVSVPPEEIEEIRKKRN